MARWVGAQGQVNLAKKVKTCPHFDVTHPAQTRKEKKLNLKYCRRLAKSIEGLNSSLAQSASELWCCKVCI